jgi:hypothetical protein
MCNVLCLKRKVMSESKQTKHGTKNVTLCRSGQWDYDYIWYVDHRNDNKKSMIFTTFYVCTAYIVCLLQDM